MRQTGQHQHRGQNGHETDRISHEHGVIVQMEAPAERKQQPHERHRDRDQQPAVLVGVRLHLVERQAGVGLELLQSVIDHRHVAGNGVDLAVADDLRLAVGVDLRLWRDFSGGLLHHREHQEHGEQEQRQRETKRARSPRHSGG
jgi:hypothetical protein